MKKFLAGFIVASVLSGFLVPIIIVPAIVKVTEEAIERAAECAVGGAITGPANLLINGVELGAGLVDGAFDVGGDLIDFGAGLFGIGDDDDGYRWSEDQLQIAATFISHGLTYKHHPDPARQIGDREIISILAAGLVETEMQNLPHGHDTSVGTLQLLDIHGTFAERMNLSFQASWYFDTLLQLMPNSDYRNGLTIGQISANVERPAEEYRHRYDDRVDEATALYQALSPSLSGSIAVVGGGLTVDIQNEVVDLIRDGGWQTILFDAEFGRQITEVVELVANWQDEYDPTLWVFDLGDSDLGAIGSVADVSAMLDAVEEVLPDDANQAWVTLYDETSNADELFNEALAIRDARTANFNVIPWATYIAERPDDVLSDGQSFSSRAQRERAAMIARVAIDPVSYGFDERELGGGGGQFSVNLPSACDVGETIFGVAKTAVGAVFNPVSAGQSFIGWAFGERGIDIDDDTLELLRDGEEIDPTQIQPGDLIIFREDPEDDSLVTSRAVYLGGSEMIREPDVGDVITIEQVDWADTFVVIRLDIAVDINGDIAPIEYEDTVMSEGFRVHPDLADPLARLISHARDQGINLGGGAWRSSESQIELRKAHCGTSNYAIYDMPSRECSPPTARPGSSMHERGLAVDFTCDGEIIGSRDNSCFIYLAANAERIAGLQNYPVEPWHWSVNGK